MAARGANRPIPGVTNKGADKPARSFGSDGHSWPSKDVARNGFAVYARRPHLPFNRGIVSEETATRLESDYKTSVETWPLGERDPNDWPMDEI